MSTYTNFLYQRSPIWAQQAIISGLALARQMLRQGHSIKSIAGQLKRTQWLSEEALLEFQLRNLMTVIRHAAEHVPYYTDLFRRERIDPTGFSQPTDLGSIPMLTKREVVKAGDSLVARGGRRLRFKGTTSGTTGLTLSGYRDLRSIHYEKAFLGRQREWAGYKPGQKRAWIRGEMIVPTSQSKPPFWRMNYVENMLMLSSFHLSEANAPSYIDALTRFDPVLIEAYPSSIAFLARYLNSRGQNYSGRNLKGIVTSSEMLIDEQRTSVNQAFGCGVYDWYGTYERVAAIGTCEKGRYHVISDYGFIEFLPLKDGSMEIVGTGFYNDTMPLIRYRTGDNVILANPGTRCSCGRAFPVVEKVIGRLDDYIKTPDGRRIGIAAMIFDWLTDVWEGQIIQDKLDEIRILVVPMRALTKADENTFRYKAQQVVGPEMKIVIEVVNEIPRTTRGKHRIVICNV